MSRFIRLPHVTRWTYESRPCDSRPCFSPDGVLVNLDAVDSIYELTENNTMVGRHQVPLSVKDILRAWQELAVPLSEVSATPLAYHPSWDATYNVLHSSHPKQDPS